MAEAKLDTRTARRAYSHRTKPYYRLIRRGALPVHLGYYRKIEGRPGTWIGRRYLGNGHYETSAVGTADDDPRQPANGHTVLTFDEAQAAVLAWADQRLVVGRVSMKAACTPTVRGAIEDYLTARGVRDARAAADVRLRLEHHVLSAPIAQKLLSELTEVDFDLWRSALRRGGRGRKRSSEPLAAGTLARVLNDFRAALRAAARKARLPLEVSMIISLGCTRPEGAARPRPKQVLPAADVQRLIQAAWRRSEDFGVLIMLMAATGARMGQLAQAKVSDVQPERKRLMVPSSKKGRGSNARPHIAVPLPNDVLSVLKARVFQKAAHEPLLTRWHHRQTAGDREAGRLPSWERVEQRPWSCSAEITRDWKALLRTTGLPAELVPYSLRHSSIVRGLRANLPVRLVAAVHDTSIAMIEQHYGAFIVDATEDLLRQAIASFEIALDAA